MKYSLLFLTFLLIWAALLINGWLVHIHCNDLRKNVDSQSALLSKIFIPADGLQAIEDEKILREQVRPIQQYHEQVVRAIEANRIADLDLKKISVSFPVVVWVRRIPGFRTDHTKIYKIRIPDDRNVKIRADFNHGQQAAENESKVFSLPTGEYAIRISPKVNADQALISVTVQVAGLKPFEWTHDLSFHPTKRLGSQVFKGKAMLNSFGEPLVLVSESQSISGFKQQVDMSLSLIDVTENDEFDIH